MTASPDEIKPVKQERVSMQDKEIQSYRDLMHVPDTFEEGFGVKSIVAAIFLGFLMVPGSMYLQLFMGAGLGPAAQWVTLILFAEVAKRSMKSLRQQEIFVLFYMTGIAVNLPLHLLWAQYLSQSPIVSAMGIDVPSWVAPNKEILAQSGRTYFTQHWVGPIAMLIGAMLINRLNTFGLGYALYRLTAHVEKLPFPMAPVGALGVTALAETRESTQKWRWRMFSLGGVMGLGFGFIYAGVPAVTGALFGHPVMIIPIPFLDLTPTMSTVNFLPATPLNLVFDMSLIILGMVLPFWAVIGGLVGLISTLIMNPVLYRQGVLTSWTPGMDLIHTSFSNSIDFYLSFGIGMTLAIFLVSLVPVVKSIARVMKKKNETTQQVEQEQTERRNWSKVWQELVHRDRARGDVSILAALMVYVVSTIGYISLCVWLMPGDPHTGVGKFPWLFFVGFAFIYQPIIGYTNVKLEGLVGQTVQIPLVREASFILSGYRGSEIWFAPIPMPDVANAAQSYRVMELTGTKLTSVLKSEFLVFPITVIGVVLFSQLIWRLAPVPSEAYPFVQKIWHLNALNFSLTVSATLDGSSPFLEAIKFDTIGWGMGVGVFLFAVLSFMNLPTFLIYGVVRGLGHTTPGAVIPELIGALIGKFYLEKKLGTQVYKQYMSVLLAGFMAGVGLVGMAAVAIALIVKSTTTLGY